MGKEKKEIGKLLELLNEYDRIKGDKEEPIYNWKIAIKTKIYQTYLISARYGFIKWLVEDDKIDRDRVREIDISISFHDEYDGFYSDDAKELLMILSIQDEPIEYLISILK